MPVRSNPDAEKQLSFLPNEHSQDNYARVATKPTQTTEQERREMHENKGVRGPAVVGASRGNDD